MARLTNDTSDSAGLGATDEAGGGSPGRQARQRAVPEFLDIGEVAALFGRARRTIRWWIATGRLPVVRIGRTPFVPETAISALLGTAGVSDPDGAEQ